MQEKLVVKIQDISLTRVLGEGESSKHIVKLINTLCHTF